ncbi:hypothetical protein [Streptomyces sp. 6-11-2]|uniref:hypothetical protein n=1 Tax=Streptomyces sp. 6-11-2 TaxID=2585753 RepID=UPI001143D606|nr:hypothetical protein [Streptomyces sp. 6-11-2]GED87758.1 hypothetical protein TNCT6_48430 [Streptomyces sp. 6-11-2]
MEPQKLLKPSWFPGNGESYAILLAILDKQKRAPEIDLSEFPSEAQRQEICEILTDELLTSGFEDEWKINHRGDLIEGLIDIFNPYV